MYKPKLLFLLLLSLVLQITGAVEFQVFRDESAGKKYTHNAAYINSVRFGAVVELSKVPKDEMIVKLAQDGLESMHKQRIGTEKVPTVMSAFAVGKKVYLSSSIRGAPWIYKYTSDYLKKHPENTTPVGEINQAVLTEVGAALNTCRDSLIEKGGPATGSTHTNEAQCGEISALWAYMLDTGKSIANLKANQGRIVSWERTKSGKERIKPPCKPLEEQGKPVTFGCQEVLDNYKGQIRVITNKAPKSDGSMIMKCERRDLLCN